MTTALLTADLPKTPPRKLPMLMWIVAVFALVAFSISPATYGYQLLGYVAVFLRTALPFLTLAGVGFALKHSPHEPIKALRELVKAKFPAVWPVVLLYLAAMASFTTLKTSIPEVVPFYADPALAALDRAIHGGDAGLWLHEILPGQVGRSLFFLYGIPWYLYWIGTVIYVAVLPDSALRSRYLYAFVLKLIVVGVVCATAMSSVGPVYYDHFYGGSDFAGLTEAIRSVPGVDDRVGFMDYLLDQYESGDASLGSGISAFPSIHCAAVFLNALFWGRINRLIGVVAWCFAGTILVGSVYTGWHYAVDGYASLAIVTAIWFGVGFCQRRFSRP